MVKPMVSSLKGEDNQHNFVLIDPFRDPLLKLTNPSLFLQFSCSLMVKLILLPLQKDKKV